jgi:hypothetical protein
MARPMIAAFSQHNNPDGKTRLPESSLPPRKFQRSLQLQIKRSNKKLPFTLDSNETKQMPIQ